MRYLQRGSIFSVMEGRERGAMSSFCFCLGGALSESYLLVLCAQLARREIGWVRLIRHLSVMFVEGNGCCSGKFWLESAEDDPYRLSVSAAS